MRASFKLLGQGSDDVSSAMDLLNLGNLVNGQVITVIPEGVILELVPNGMRGFLAKQHLSDNLDHSDKLLSCIKEGDELVDLVVISKDVAHGQVHVTAKPWLVQQAKTNLISQFEELKTGMVIPGYIKNVTETACFISFLGGFVAMATSHNIADTFVTNAADHFVKGQSVIASISKIDLQEFKIFASLKESVLAASSAEMTLFETQRLKSLLEERDRIRLMSVKPEKGKETLKWAHQFTVGCGVQGSVKAVVPYGTILDLESGGSGLITHSNKGAHKQGQKLFGQVLDMDMAKKILDLKPIASIEDALLSSDKKVVKAVSLIITFS